MRKVTDRLIAVFFLVGFALSASAGDVITRDDGSYAEAPAGYKAVFVPGGTPVKGLVSVKGVKVIVPDFEAPVGSEPEYDFYDFGSDGTIDSGPAKGCSYDPYDPATLQACYN